jgi:hypothetical protein
MNPEKATTEGQTPGSAVLGRRRRVPLRSIVCKTAASVVIAV